MVVSSLASCGYTTLPKRGGPTAATVATVATSRYHVVRTKPFFPDETIPIPTSQDAELPAHDGRAERDRDGELRIRMKSFDGTCFGECICYIFGRTLLTINSSSSAIRVYQFRFRVLITINPSLQHTLLSPFNNLGIRNRPSPLTCANIPTFQRRHELGHGRAGRRARMVYDGWSTETGRRERRDLSGSRFLYLVPIFLPVDLPIAFSPPLLYEACADSRTSLTSYQYSLAVCSVS